MMKNNECQEIICKKKKKRKKKLTRKRHIHLKNIGYGNMINGCKLIEMEFFLLYSLDIYQNSLSMLKFFEYVL